MEALKQQRASHFYEFGPFRVDTAKCVLLRNGDAVPLSLKVFEILMVLIENRGQLLEKDELLRQVWPDTVVEENNLARSISALRKALDEQPNEHRYILTVPGRGYRFVANVREIEAGAAGFGEDASGLLIDNAVDAHRTNGIAVTGEVTTRKAAPVSDRRIALLAVLSLVALGIAAIGIVILYPRAKIEPSVAQRKLWQLTFDGGLQSEPTWSPDGRMVAYSSDRNGNF